MSLLRPPLRSLAVAVPVAGVVGAAFAMADAPVNQAVPKLGALEARAKIRMVGADQYVEIGRGDSENKALTFTVKDAGDADDAVFLVLDEDRAKVKDVAGAQYVRKMVPTGGRRFEYEVEGDFSDLSAGSGAAASQWFWPYSAAGAKKPKTYYWTAVRINCGDRHRQQASPVNRCAFAPAPRSFTIQP